MIKCEIAHENSHYRRLVVEGHAGSAEKGRDLVCAAVSVLAQTLVNALHKLAQIELEDPDIEIFSGYIMIDLGSRANDTSDLLVEFFRIGMQGLADTYPEYVRMKNRRKQ